MARAARVLLGNRSAIYYRNTDANGAGTGAYVRIPSVVKIVLPELDSEEIDTSDLDSEEGVKEYDLGDTDPGTSSCDVHYNPDNSVHQALIAATLDKSIKEFKVHVSNSAKAWVWKGRIKKFSPSLERNSPVTAPVEIRNTGPFQVIDD